MVDRVSSEELRVLQGLEEQVRTLLPSLEFNDPAVHAWKQRMQAAVRRLYGENSRQEKDLHSATRFNPIVSYQGANRKEQHHRAFLNRLPEAQAFAHAVLEDIKLRYEAAGQSISGKLRIFIAHDGDTGARDKLEGFIRDLGAQPIIAENQPSKGQNISEKVNALIKSCDYVVVIATRAKASQQDCRLMARGNVINELARIRELLGDRRMLALEHGVELPSNEAASIHKRFSSQSMDGVFSELVRELNAHGFLKVGAPSGR